MTGIDQPTTPNPYAASPDAGNQEACDCHGAWHAMEQHCVDWPCPGCTNICQPEPGTQDATARMQDWVAASGVFDDEEEAS